MKENLISFERIVLCDHVASTQEEVHRLGSAGESPPFAVRAREQHAGRGRYRRRWQSPRDAGIYVTFAFADPAPAEQRHLLQAAVAVAAAQSAAAISGLPCLLKWPNDLLVRDHKIGGMMAECFSDFSPRLLAVGLGLNVNTSREELPDRPIFPASSLALECGRSLDQDLLFDSLLLTLNRSLADLHQHGDGRIRSEWGKRQAMTGRRVSIATAIDTRTGTVESIDLYAGLFLRTDTGKLLSILSGDLRLCE